MFRNIVSITKSRILNASSPEAVKELLIIVFEALTELEAPVEKTNIFAGKLEKALNHEKEMHPGVANANIEAALEVIRLYNSGETGSGMPV